MTLLQTQSLTASYGLFQALFGVSLRLDEGETIAVIGANGAGKSSLMRAICGILRSAPEQVMLDGKPSATCPRKRWPSLASRWSPRGANCSPRYRSKRTC